jgi:hypothetical protein
MEPSSWVVTIIGAVTTIVLAIIHRDTKATRQTLIRQIAEISRLEAKVSLLEQSLQTSQKKLSDALDENLRLLRKLFEAKNGK